jgi:hypothetical protein
VAIVTYGNGVVAALQARAALSEADITVIDCPYLSHVPAGLASALPEYENVVFADPCKEGQNPLAGFISQLKQQGRLPAQWTAVAAANAYNPLGSYITFLSASDIEQAVLSLFKKSD